MAIYKKHILLAISIISLGAFLISRYVNTGLIPNDFDNLKIFLLQDINYFEIIAIVIFMILGSFIGSKKACPNCKSIDHVKKGGKRLIGRENMGTHVTHNGPHSVVQQQVKETHETSYSCGNCNHQWIEVSTNTRKRQSVNSHH